MVTPDPPRPSFNFPSGTEPSSYIRALLNILEDSASEKEQLHGAQSAVLNILEDSASEKQQLHGAQSAVLNILEDSASEKEQLRETQSAVLNILEDFAADKARLEDMKEAILNILEDLGAERLQLSDRTAQIEAANKELEGFAYSVSHDLRAPLRGIDGWSMALLEDYGAELDARAQQYLDRIRSETQRMGQLIDHLLLLSRLTRTELRREPLDVTALVRSIAARLSETYPDRHIEFKIEPGLTVLADPHLMEIALTNLLENAVKFTGRRAQALIEVGRTEEQEPPTFFVRDNGAGFDMAYAGVLFGVFQRLHRATEFPGTGVGLATVQRVIHRHGGRIWAEAQVDRGATFYFTLGAPNDGTGSAGRALSLVAGSAIIRPITV